MVSLIGRTFNVILISYVHLRAGITLRGSESSSQGGEISEAESGYSLEFNLLCMYAHQSRNRKKSYAGNP